MFRRVVTPSTAATAAVAVAVPRRFLYEYKFGQTPLTVPFGGPVALSPPPPPPPSSGPHSPPSSPPASAERGAVTVTKLHNGARIISHDRGGPMVSVGAYVLAGPVYDPPNCPGVGAMLPLALTTSNFNHSLFQLDRNLRSLGAAQAHFEKGKHYVGLRVDCRADKWRAVGGGNVSKKNAAKVGGEPSVEVNLMQDNLFTCLSAPRFHETDLERFRDTIDNQLKELRWQYPAQFAVQMLETVAFYREPLGNPRFVPEQNNGNITSKVLLEQYSRYVVPSRVVIAGVNVKHDDLIAEYENTPFPHSATAPHHAKADKGSAGLVDYKNEQSQYVGGERQDHEDRAKEMGTKPDMESETICAIGWLAAGRDKTVLKDYAASLVFQNLLDMQLKDGVRYNKDETHVHQGVRSFYNPYQTAGLIGVTVTAEPANAVKMVTDTVKLVQAKKSPSQGEVEAAKHRAAMQFLNQNADNIRDYCDFLGTSLSFDPSQVTSTTLEEVVDAIKSVGAADVKKVTDLMFSKPTSFYGHGEMLGFPSKRQMGL